ncbi:hypothetical protein PIROE2DRAFT_65196 [Piromyces sp. E2]|nr:hypothetical protein PIROE2DRAFT_65196 [Piromyces sp. E2]|eukprot:OUM57092.1 hypothetical protein PIROE2DRAFT_65196 [Piromyces sp. E2]
MLFFSAIIAIALVTNVLGAIEEGQYYYLNGATTKAYLFIGEDDCNKGFKDDIYNCYLRSEYIDKVNKIFGPGDRDSPSDCKTKGYVNINSNKCYFTNTGTGGETYNKLLVMNRIPYFDIDFTTKRALTEYGWCTFETNEEELHWISKISDDIQINQINFPGTHDSGTYAIGDTGFNIFNIRILYGRTQEVSIYEQMMNGIRYFDIRIETNKDKEIYLTHDKLDCINRNTGKKYYLEDVFNEAVEFLGNNPNETIIMHLKDDNMQLSYKITNSMNGYMTTTKIEGYDSYKDVYKAIADLSILKTDPTKFSKKYNEFFYNKNQTFPKLGEVRNKIVLLTHGKWKYNDNGDQVGNEVNIPDMSECHTYPNSDNQKCYPRIHESNINVLVQDNYKLQSGKQRLVQEFLDHKIPIMYTNTEYASNNELTNTFYDSNNLNTLTIDFMNIQGDIFSLTDVKKMQMQ